MSDSSLFSPPDVAVIRHFNGVRLTQKGSDALDKLQQAYPTLNPSDIFNRALQVYAAVQELGPVYVADDPHNPKEFSRMDIKSDTDT